MTTTTELTEAFNAMQDTLAEQAEMAAGYRARLETMGWSPTVAEQLAAAVLVHMQAKMLGEAK
jgi:nitrogen fixation/metabolism regulation signal transduction histidine kinase